MSFIWTKKIRDKILLQLADLQLPFKKYSFCRNGQELEILGTGAYASVYAAEAAGCVRKQYAIKVVGFGDKHVDSAEFEKVTRMQKYLHVLDKNIVKVYEAVELKVWIDTENTVLGVQEVSADFPGDTKGDFLNLQFIVMERLQPVLVYDKIGNPQITIKELALFDEKEILKLAINIATALNTAHERGVLHRDIKLENIFYDSKNERYKLGDFGIAKITLDGMASTVAFTKGYGAPEVVGSLDEQYDDTADIYSFGVLLFVLLNEMKFPGALNYSVNSREQYSLGYVFPRPKRGVERFTEMVRNMCRFHPDERYQSMEEVLNEAEAIMYKDFIDFRRRHAGASKLLGVLMLWGGLLFGLQTFYAIQSYKWVVVSLVLMAAVMLYDYVLKVDRDPKWTKRFLVRNRYWFIILLMYVLIFVQGLLMNTDNGFIFERIMGERCYQLFLEWETVKVGAVGSLFSFAWIVREYILLELNKFVFHKRES